MKQLEDDRAVLVDENPIVEVTVERSGEHDPLQVTPDPHEILDRVTVADPGHVLVDDRTGVELLGHVVGSRPDQLDAPLVGAAVRIGAGERREERVVDVEHRTADAFEELAG